MKTANLMVLAVIFGLLFATPAAAAESKGIIDRILDFIKNIINGITGSKTTTTTTTTTRPLCSPPYLKVGGECCLDENSNGICDSDEITTTTTKATTTKPTTTTRQTTTTVRTTTEPTTTTIIKCSSNLDCGTSIDENICYEKSIYKVTKIPMCKNPGTEGSYCYIKQVGPSVLGQLVGKVQDCPNGCDPATVTCRSE
jgi:hypothetical protein